jgi:hypothetical protein
MVTAAGMQHLRKQGDPELRQAARAHDVAWSLQTPTGQKSCRRRMQENAARPTKRESPTLTGGDLSNVSWQLGQHSCNAPTSGRTKDVSKGACEAQAADQRQAAAAGC